MDDFDDGVLYQLGQKRSEDEAVGALRVLAESNLANMQVKQLDGDIRIDQPEDIT